MGEREDTGRPDNPFLRALELRREDPALSGLRPSEGDDLGPSPLKQAQLRTVADLGIADPELVRKNPKVAELTVHDLNDLVDEVSGIPSHNPKVGELTIDDMQDLEGVFLEFKVNAARGLAQADGGKLTSSVDVSCCCCTPCCCCAAAEVEPIRA